MLDILLLVKRLQPFDQLDSATFLARWLAEVEPSDLAFCHQEGVEGVKVAFAAAHEALSLGWVFDHLFWVDGCLFVVFGRTFSRFVKERCEVITCRVLVYFEVFLCERLSQRVFYL
jgi:hypothetical protein